MARAPSIIALLTLYTLVLGAQAPVQEVAIRTHSYTPPSTFLRAESNLVETGLTVRDGGGHAVAGLHAADFALSDNGAPQTITAFSELRADGVPLAGPSGIVTAAAGAAAPLPPRYVTFFFDDFHVANGSMLFVKQGARAFLAKGLKASDHVSIVTASGQGDLDFTTDAKVFAAALEHLGSHVRPVVPGYCGVSPIDSYIFLHNLDGQIREEAIGAAMKCAGCSPGDAAGECRVKAIGIAQQEASTAWEQMRALSVDTMDALGFAAKKLSQTSGTRILVLTSSGFLLEPGVTPQLQNFIDGAVRWNIVVHAIGAQGLEAGMGGARNSLRRMLPLLPLENIADGTGGHYFRDTNDLGGAMELAADPEVSYSLAFNPGAPDGKFHALKIKFQAKSAMSLQYRPGYFSPDPTKKEKSARTRMDEAVLTKDALREVPTSLELGTGKPKDGVVPVSIRVTVDVKALQFTLFQGRHMQQIVFLTTLLDANGGFVTGKESIMDLALSDERLASLRSGGLKAVVTLGAPAGSYQVRTVVREGMKGNLGASTTPVELRGN